MAKVCLTDGKKCLTQYNITTVEMWSQSQPTFETKVCKKIVFLDIFRACSSLEDCYHKPVIQNCM